MSLCSGAVSSLSYDFEFSKTKMAQAQGLMAEPHKEHAGIDPIAGNGGMP